MAITNLVLLNASRLNLNSEILTQGTSRSRKSMKWLSEISEMLKKNWKGITGNKEKWKVELESSGKKLEELKLIDKGLKNKC